MSAEAALKMGADGREEDKPGWHQRDDQSFADWMDTRVARYETRHD